MPIFVQCLSCADIIRLFYYVFYIKFQKIKSSFYKMKKALSIISILFFSSAIFAQIPNGGFESWSNGSGYNTPDYWDNMNSMTASMSVYTCTKGTPGNPGAAYLKLVTKNVSGMGLIPGIATCGMMDKTNANMPALLSGFAYNQRPADMAGKWQYMAYGSDQGFINVTLTKWNMAQMKRDTIGSSMQALSGMVMSWADFSMPMTYLSLQFPDSAFITLSASGASPAANSYLYADTLRFEGSVAGTTGINETEAIANVSVYPNPATDALNIRFTSLQNSDCSIQLINTDGEVIKEMNEGSVSGSKELRMNTGDLAQGIYLLRIISAQGSVSKRVVIL